MVCAHAAVNVLVGPPPDQAEVLSDRASGLAVLPIFVAIVLGGMLVFSACVASKAWQLAARPFAALPPLFFALLEIGESVAAHQSPVGHCVEAPAFWVGLLLQAPVALACYLVARLLARGSRAVNRSIAAIARPVIAVLVFACAAMPRSLGGRPASLRLLRIRGRGPPVVCAPLV